MPKIIRNTIFLILIIFSVIKLPSANAMDYSINVNFDRIKPSEVLSLTRSIPAVFATEKVNGIQIEVSEPLSGINGKQRIPVGRLRLLLDGQPFQLANSAVTINFADQINTTGLINLALELKINPEDRADQYTGKVILRTWVNGTGGKEWRNVVTVKLTAEIQPWIKMQCETNQIILDQLNYTKTDLVNRQPVHLRIASNSNWILVCNVIGSDCGLHPDIKFLSVRNSQFQILNQNTSVTCERKSLALGSATGTGGAYWLDLLLGIEINDFSTYAAKEYIVPLQFTALLWDGKTKIP